MWVVQTSSLCASLLMLATGKCQYNIKLWKTFTDCFNCLPQQDIWLLWWMWVIQMSGLCASLLMLATGKCRHNIKLWKTFRDCFNCLPIAAIIDEKIFTMHGGLSPDLQSMEQIWRVMRPTDVPDHQRFRWWKIGRVLTKFDFSFSTCATHTNTSSVLFTAILLSLFSCKAAFVL
jgi:hypothetical protein